MHILLQIRKVRADDLIVVLIKYTALQLFIIEGLYHPDTVYVLLRSS